MMRQDFVAVCGSCSRFGEKRANEDGRRHWNAGFNSKSVSWAGKKKPFGKSQIGFLPNVFQMRAVRMSQVLERACESWRQSRGQSTLRRNGLSQEPTKLR